MITGSDMTTGIETGIETGTETGKETGIIRITTTRRDNYPLITPNSLPILVKAAIHLSKCSISCPAEI
jgi:hypothetical protein